MLAAELEETEIAVARPHHRPQPRLHQPTIAESIAQLEGRLVEQLAYREVRTTIARPRRGDHLREEAEHRLRFLLRALGAGALLVGLHQRPTQSHACGDHQ